MAKPDCSPLARVLHDIAMNIGSRPEVKDLDGVVAEMKKHIPEIDRRTLVDAIQEASAGRAQDKTALQKKLEALKREAGSDRTLRGAISAYQKAAAEGTVPPKQPRASKAPPEAIAKLRAERDEVAAQVAQNDPKLRERARVRIAELEKHIAEGTAPKAQERPPAPADLQALRDRRDELAAQVRQAAPAQKAALQARIAELEGHLKAGTLPEKRAAAPLSAPEKVAALRQQRDDLLAALRRSEPALRQRFEGQIAELTGRIRAGDFAESAKPERPPLTPQLERMAYQRDRLRQQINQNIRALRPKTFWQRAAAVVGEPLNVTRSLLVSLNLSAMRHGAIVSLGHPILAAKAVPAGIRSFVSASKAHAINEGILNRPNAPLYQRAGLYLAKDEAGAKLSAQEEAFMSRLVGKIPGLAGSNRAYATYLNKMRADHFDALSETLARGGEPTLEESRAIANYVNVATGRGLHGSLENAATALNHVFFAPRYVASRFEYLAGQPLYGGSARTRGLVASEYARTLTGAAVMYGIAAAAGASITFDPRSSDFGKIRFGNTRIDPLGGIAQAVTFLGRMASGANKTEAGKLRPAPQPETAGRFLRSKLAPIPGAILDVSSGKNAVGEKVTLGSEAGRLLVPLPIRDTIEEMKEHGVPAGMATAILSGLAFGVEHHQPKGSR